MVSDVDGLLVTEGALCSDAPPLHPLVVDFDVGHKILRLPRAVRTTLGQIRTFKQHGQKNTWNPKQYAD